MKKRLFFLFSCFCLLFPLYGQFEHYIRFGTREGLPSMHIYQLLEDTEGYIWLATNRGVARYDGRTFRVFKTADGLPANDIWQLEITPDGKVWYLCKSKRLGYIWHDKVYTYPIENAEFYGYTFYIGQDQIRLHGRSGNYAGFLVLENGAWRIKDTLDRRMQILLKTLSLQLPGKRWMIFEEDSVYVNREDKENSAGRHLFTFRDLSTRPPVNPPLGLGICRTWNDSIMVRSAGNMMSIFDLKKHTMVSADVIFGREPDFTYQFTPEFQRYGDRYIQVSRYNEFSIVDKDLNIVENHRMPKIFSAAHILKDRGGNYWMGGPRGGLCVFPSYSGHTRVLFPGKKVGFAEWVNGRFFIHVQAEGLYLYDPQKNTYRNVVSDKDGLYMAGYHPALKMYYVAGDHYTWSGKDPYRLEKRAYHQRWHNGKRIQVIPSFKDIIPLQRGFATVSGSAVFFMDSLQRAEHDQDKIPVSRMINGGRRIIHWKNRLYVGGNGLYTLRNDSLVMLSPRNETKANIIFMAPFNSNYMMLGTDGGGLYLYDGQKDLRFVGGTENLVINRALLHKGDLWLATDNGVHRIRPAADIGESRLLESFYEEDGLLSNNVNSMVFMGDTLWAAQDEGLVAINVQPGRFRRRVKPYFNTRDTHRLNDSTYTLTYGDLENIELHFGVLCLPAQGHFVYDFKLGEESEWFRSAGTTLSLGKMSPGERMVYFRATDQHGNSGQFRLLLQVRPLWYQTLWAKAALGLFILLLAVGITLLLRLRTERRQKAALRLKGRMSELELQALRSQMNPHFVFNSLNAIQFFVIKNKVELSEAYLAKFSKLVRMFFEYSRYDSLRLEQEIDLLERYLEIEKLRFEDKLSYRVEVDERLDTEEMEIPSMILQPIVENAVNHGVFHKKGNGSVWVSFIYIDENTVKVEVRDDGIGINAMKELYATETRNYRTRSSEVLKERLKILSENKMSRWEVTYSVRDLTDEDPALAGTRVDITFIYKPAK
ncbi:MAG: histidine kinase [Bacteroidia bacterium]|nr:histidine kinase [Bacteroidia bacterium]